MQSFTWKKHWLTFYSRLPNYEKKNEMKWYKTGIIICVKIVNRIKDLKEVRDAIDVI